MTTDLLAGLRAFASTHMALESRIIEAQDAQEIVDLIDALTLDKVRLDWMQENDACVRVSDDEAGSCYVQSNTDYTRYGHAAHYDIRAAIDAARGAQ